MDLPRSLYYQDIENPIAKLFWGKIKLEMALSAFTFIKKGKVQGLMHELKYKGNTKVGELLGIELGKEFDKAEITDKVDVVVPVPLHKKKLKQRGYNQSEFIAIGVARVLNCEMNTNLLKRIEHSESQTKKSKYERWENVGAAFTLTDANRYRGKHILLVDDVVTTGATLEACCKKLEEIEGVKLSIGTLASA
ncbi:phosphoribosyltransferase family protein [Flavobacteriales bacterium]|nr:phosphoribosyltransferase family protein [Flavobacteriales bacterium]